MDNNYIKLDKRAKKCMRISAVLILGTVMLIATLILIFAVDAGIIGNIVLAVCWGLAIAYIIAAPRVRYERYRYCIDEEAIRVREGFLWVSEAIVPIERLHKIEVSQGPVSGMFHLTTICVTTAGGDVNIKFLREGEAAEIAETLKTKINSIAAEEKKGR